MRDVIGCGLCVSLRGGDAEEESLGVLDLVVVSLTLGEGGFQRLQRGRERDGALHVVQTIDTLQLRVENAKVSRQSDAGLHSRMRKVVALIEIRKQKESKKVNK